MALLNSISQGTNVFSSGHRTHYCAVFKNDSERFSAVVPHILEGLRRNDKCVFVADRMEKADLFEHMMKAAPVSEDLLETRISFLSADDVYLEDGRFDMERMLRFIADTREQSLRDGYSGLTATGEMTWANREVPGTSDLIEYEARINFMYPKASADILCMYPESEFDPSTLVNAIRAHPKVIVRGTVCGNPYFLPPDTLISYLSGATTMDVFDRMEKELFGRSVRSEIESLESRELRRARMCLSVLDGMALDDLRDRLVAASFYHELALGTCKDDCTSADIMSADSRCRELMDRLEALKSFRTCMDAPAEWLPLEGVVLRAAEVAFAGSKRISLDLGQYRVFVSSAADKALAAVLASVAERCPASAPVEIKVTETEFGLVVSIGAEGPGVPQGAKESLFDLSEPCPCGRSLCLSRAVLEFTGISLREIGLPGFSTVFEMRIPITRYRVD